MPSWVISLGIASLMAAAIVVLWRVARRIDHKHPRCGACRYNVHGLSTTICPECGADLAVIGLWSPRQARISIAAIQVLLLAVGAWLLLTIVIEHSKRVLPVLAQVSRSDQLAPVTTETTTHFKVEASTQAWVPLAHFQGMMLAQNHLFPSPVFPEPDRSVKLVVSFRAACAIHADNRSNTHRINHVDGRVQESNGKVDAAVLAGWLASLPIQYSRDERAIVSRQLHHLLQLHLFADDTSADNLQTDQAEPITANGMFPMQMLLGRGTLTARTLWLEPALWCMLGLMTWGFLSFRLLRAALRSPSPSLVTK